MLGWKRKVIFHNTTLCRIALQKAQFLNFQGLKLNRLYLLLPSFCSIFICCQSVFSSVWGVCREKLWYDLSNISYRMDTLCSNNSNNVTEILKQSNRNFRTICLRLEFLKFWTLIPCKSNLFNISSKENLRNESGENSLTFWKVSRKGSSASTSSYSSCQLFLVSFP